MTGESGLVELAFSEGSAVGIPRLSGLSIGEDVIIYLGMTKGEYIL